MGKYLVYVDDNFHSGDESERYKLGEYETREEALAACKGKVEEYFERIPKGKYSFKELWDGYMMYGEDASVEVCEWIKCDLDVPKLEYLTCNLVKVVNLKCKMSKIVILKCTLTCPQY